MKFNDAIYSAVKKFTSSDFIRRVKEEDESMLEHLNILKKINSYGYITTESQAGRKHSGVSPIDGKPYVIQERAYVCGFMLETFAPHFIKNMALYTDKNAMYIPYCENSIHIPSNLDIPLTTTTKDDKIEVDTHMSSVLPYSRWEKNRKELNINKTEKIVFIFCWDLHWNRNASKHLGLFNDIEKILKM